MKAQEQVRLRNRTQRALSPRDAIADLPTSMRQTEVLTLAFNDCVRAHTPSETGRRKRNSLPLRLRGERQDRRDGKSAENRTTYDDSLQTDLHFLQSNPSHHSKQDILTNTNLDPTTWPTLAPQLNNHSLIHRTGEKRGTRYQWTKGDDE